MSFGDCPPGGVVCTFMMTFRNVRPKCGTEKLDTSARALTRSLQTYVRTRCLMVSTNQADPGCFHFKILMNIDGMTLILFFSSPPFSAGPQKPQTLTP